MKHTRKKSILIKNLLFAFLTAATTSMTISLYPMLNFLINNQDEFWFSINEMFLPVCILFGIIALALFLLLALLCGKKTLSFMYAISGLFIAGSLCYYIQTNFMSSYLPILTGDAIDWSVYRGWGMVSIALWCIVPVTFIILFFLKRKTFVSAAKGSCAVLLAMEILTLSLTVATTPLQVPNDEIAYFSYKDGWSLSDEENVVVIVSDTFEATFLNDLLEESPEYKETFKDFTYYNNTTGISCYTYFSFAKLMTGLDFPLGMTAYEGIKHTFSNESLLSTIHENGFDIAYYTVFKPTPNLKDLVLNYVGNEVHPDPTAKEEILSLLFESTLFTGVPQPLKDNFVVLTSDYNAIQQSIDLDEQEAPYFIGDLHYRNKMHGVGITSIDAPKRFVLIEMNGVHAPLVMSRDLEYTDFPASLTIREKQLETTRGILKFYSEYIAKLKESGLYDKTTIIVLADHGYDLRFYPVLLVKEAGASGTELTIDSTPLSLQEDFVPLIDSVTSGSHFSEAVDSLNIPEDRVRYALNFRSNDYAEKTTMRSVIEINGPAWDENSYRPVSDEYWIDESFPGRYIVGSAFDHADANDIIGMYGFTSDTHQMYTHSAVADIHFQDTISTPLLYETEVRNITDINQTLLVCSGEKHLAEVTVAPGEAHFLQIPISSDLIKNQSIVLNFEAPNATLRHGEIETLEWSTYNSFAFEAGMIRFVNSEP